MRWADPKFVRSWDAQTLKSSFVRREQVDMLVEIIARNYRSGRRILDLGCGTGLVEARILSWRPKAKITGVDISPVMVEFAARRLREYPGFAAVRHDIGKIDSLELPSGRYQFIFSVLTMHELSAAGQRRVLAWAYDRLEPGGMLIVNDKLEFDVNGFYSTYRAVWDRQELQRPARERMSFRKYLATRMFKDGQPATLEENLERFRQAGFRAECLHLHLSRAIIIGRKGRAKIIR